MELLFYPESWPFSVALVLLLAIVLIEGAGLILGMSFSGWLDHALPDLQGDLDGLGGDWLGWLHVGKVPLLILLTLLLTTFSIVGYSIIGLARALFGLPMPALIAAPLALLASLPVVRFSALAIARLVPGDESTALPLSSLVGRIAVVVNGTARLNYPAQARTQNENGQTFYVHVEPDDAESEFTAGDSVLLVRQISGTRFQAISNPRPDLL